MHFLKFRFRLDYFHSFRVMIEFQRIGRYSISLSLTHSLSFFLPFFFLSFSHSFSLLAILNHLVDDAKESPLEAISSKKGCVNAWIMHPIQICRCNFGISFFHSLSALNLHALTQPPQHHHCIRTQFCSAYVRTHFATLFTMSIAFHLAQANSNFEKKTQWNSMHRQSVFGFSTWNVLDRHTDRRETIYDWHFYFSLIFSHAIGSVTIEDLIMFSFPFTQPFEMNRLGMKFRWHGVYILIVIGFQRLVMNFRSKKHRAKNLHKYKNEISEPIIKYWKINIESNNQMRW